MNKRRIAKQQTTNYQQDDNLIKHESKSETRLNKYISSSGFCSRREADRLIESGQVTIDGNVALVGSKVNENNKVMVNSKLISHDNKQVYLALNKPIGITCTTDTAILDNISDFMSFPERIFPIGRLDKNSSGLILLTNDGDVVNKILRSTNDHEKEYIVKVNKKIDSDFVSMMEVGVRIYNPISNKYQMTKECKVNIVDDQTFNIILTEGLNRQIRRMCEQLGYKVVSLKRIRVMNISLADLKVGEWRYLSNHELEKLNKSINE